MVQKDYIFRFLRDLSNNNSKEWMDDNRDRYHTAKERWLEEVDLILKRLAKHDPFFAHFQPKDTISRINNNRRFQQDKPVYKDYFNCMPMSGESSLAPIAIAAGISWSFIGAGLHMPDNDQLKKMRDAIDYDGEALKAILNTKEFQNRFGGLSEDKNALKTAPRGYDTSHPHIELIRRKSFTATTNLTQKIVASDGFVDYVEESYLILQPFVAYIGKALSIDQ
ncbi:MAG: DUF2461 domain-containing protein [Bacteroidota bacterium]